MQESVVVDRQVLEDWIMKGLVSPKALQSTNEEKGEEKEEKKEPSPSRSPAAMAVDSIKPEAEAESAADPNSSSTAAAGTETPGDESSPVPRKEMDNGFVVCEHGLLDPDCAYRMRRINKVSILGLLFLSILYVLTSLNFSM
jgi:cobalamin biosynthesis Mg chelatase CobN